MKFLKLLIILCPTLIFSQKTSETNSETKPYVTYCNENGEKTLNYIPLCDSLNVSDNNLKIISFTFETKIKGKQITTEITTNKMNGISKNLIKHSEEGVIYFTDIKAINTVTKQEIALPFLKINWSLD
jgi:hypothetical protein